MVRGRQKRRQVSGCATELEMEGDRMSELIEMEGCSKNGESALGEPGRDGRPSPGSCKCEPCTTAGVFSKAAK